MIKRLSKIDTLARRSNSAGLLDRKQNPDSKLLSKTSDFNMSIFDPFLDFQMSRGTTNALYSSNRTSKHQNNLLSQTFKIVHGMFGGRKKSIPQASTTDLLNKTLSQNLNLDMKFVSNLVSTVNLEPGDPKNTLSTNQMSRPHTSSCFASIEPINRAKPPSKIRSKNMPTPLPKQESSIIPESSKPINNDLSKVVGQFEKGKVGRKGDAKPELKQLSSKGSVGQFIIKGRTHAT